MLQASNFRRGLACEILSLSTIFNLPYTSLSLQLIVPMSRFNFI